MSVNESWAFEAIIPIEDSDPGVISKDTLLAKIGTDVYDNEASGIENLVLVPLKLCGVMTICYLENPLMDTLLKYILVGISFTFVVTVLELLEL